MEFLQNQTVSEWTPYSHDFQTTLKIGDLLEFHRPTHFHWGMYHVDGKVVHFSPINPEENVDPNSFVPGHVMSTPLDILAGDSYFRVNNKPELDNINEHGILRCVNDSFELMTILPNGPDFYYSERYFNSEIFATFLKFEGPPESSLLNIIAAIESGRIGRIRGEDSGETIFKKLQYMQWWENTCKTFHNETPRRVLEEGLAEWNKV